MHFGSRRASKKTREPSDLDKFLNTKYSATMGKGTATNSFDNTRVSSQGDKLSRTGSDYNDLKSRFQSNKF